MHRLPRWAPPIATSVMAIACLTSALSAQQGGDRTPRSDSLRQAQRLDIDGKHAEPRARRRLSRGHSPRRNSDSDHHHDARVGHPAAAWPVPSRSVVSEE